MASLSVSTSIRHPEPQAVQVVSVFSICQGRNWYRTNRSVIAPVGHTSRQSPQNSQSSFFPRGGPMIVSKPLLMKPIACTS